MTAVATSGLPALTCAGLAIVVVGAMWMTLAPQWPAFHQRRASLGWLTWGLSRAGIAGLLRLVLALAPARLAWILPGASLTIGGPGTAAGPWLPRVFSPEVGSPGGFAALLALWLADLAVYTLLARTSGEEGHAAWSWAASPLVWLLWAPGGQPAMVAAAGITLAWWLDRNGRGALAGLALALAMLAGTPLALLPALAVVAGARKRIALVACALVPTAAGYALAHGGHATAAFAGPAVGPTLWRLPAALAGLDPGPFGWLPFAVVALVGLVALSRRAADAPDHAAWGWAAFAALGHAVAPSSVLAWAPLVCVWAARDPDRRGWWLVYGAVLPVAWLLDLAALRVPGSPWRFVAAFMVATAVLLSAWPLRAVWRAPGSEARGAVRTPDLQR